jgi:glucokinase
MFLGIEIGGTKLQFGVGAGDGTHLVCLARREVDPAAGAAGILEQIREETSELKTVHSIRRIGVGFGGPVDGAKGRVRKSHHITGWENFPLVRWFRRNLGLPAVLGNDCDLAALSESRIGAGRGKRSVFYVTVGTGVGGGHVVNGRLQGQGRPSVSEIGHLRPGLDAVDPDRTVESLASGWSIAEFARRSLGGKKADSDRNGRRLLASCQGNLADLTAELVAEAARSGDTLALAAFRRATQALGWAIAQVLTLLSPELIVIGGGVSRSGEKLFFAPIRNEVERYVFPPLVGCYQVVPAKLGETVVVEGALLLAGNEWSRT